MICIIRAYGMLAAFGLSAGLFILGHFDLALMAAAVSVLFSWSSRISRFSLVPEQPGAKSQGFASLCFWLAIATFVIVDLIVSFANSSMFDGFPFDGPFQSFNPLRRMANGEWPLIDFTYFHGNFLPLLLYPFFVLFGKNLFAAEMARHLLDLIFFAIATVILGRGLFAERHYRRLFYIIFLAISLSSAVMTELHNPILSVHSTIVRTFPQIIAFVVAMRVVRHGKRGRQLLLEAAQVGLAAAAVFLFTNEQGVYLVVTIGAILLLFSSAGIAEKSLAVIVLVLAFAAVLLGIEALLHWDGPLAALQNIVADQVWYFGAYPNYFITKVSDLWENAGVYRLIGGIARLFIVVSLVGLIVWGVLRSKREEMAGLLALFIYGLFGTASNLGYLGLHYFDPLVRALVVALFYFFYLVASYPEAAKHAASRGFFNAAANILKCRKINFLVAFVGVAGLLWIIVRQQAIPEILTAIPHQSKNQILGVHLPGPGLGEDSRWSFWVDEAIANTLFVGKGDAARLAGYGNTVVGAEGPFQNGLVNAACLALDKGIPQGFGVGDYLRLGNVRWPLIAISEDRRHACVGLYTKAQIAAYALYAGRPDETLTGFKLERDAPGDGVRLILSNFNESGAFKINGVYVDRPAVILQKGGKRFGVERAGLPEVGDTLHFSSAGIRKVVSVYPNGYVELDQGGLDPFRDGYPRPIKVTKSTAPTLVRGSYSAKLVFAGGILLVPPSRINENLTGKRITIAEAGRSYVVVAVKPEGMIFLSDFVSLDKANDPIPRAIWYHMAVDSNWYYVEKNSTSAADYPLKIWSTYTGFPDAMAGQLNPSGTDYIIHALGKNREQYLRKFQEELPKFFISLHSIPVPTWNDWLLVNHWNLFKTALERYKIIASSMHSIYWMRQRDISPLKTEPILELEGGRGGEVSKTSAGCVGRSHEFIEFDVRYHVHNELAWLPILGSSPRAFVYLRGSFASIPVSLNPDSDRVTFPALFLCDGRSGVVAFGVEGLGARSGMLEIEHVSLRRIESHDFELRRLFGISEAVGETPLVSMDLFPNHKALH